jgi:hypothetical protein
VGIGREAKKVEKAGKGKSTGKAERGGKRQERWKGEGLSSLVLTSTFEILGVVRHFFIFLWLPFRTTVREATDEVGT